MIPTDISILDYTYELPNERIALVPSEERGRSKLLIWGNGKISDDNYINISSHLAGNSIIIFNNSRVIPARLQFKKETGASIEIFCLEPIGGYDFNNSIGKNNSCQWKCFVGGMGKWKAPFLLKQIVINGNPVELTARLINRSGETNVIEFSWDDPLLTFIEILNIFGEIPLPPYIKRKAGASDKLRYQTIFAKENGSVAAPTAALHFTEEILASLSNKSIHPFYVTLHVGAGTFKPVKAAQMKDHEMHSEWIEISLDGIKELLKNNGKTITAVGTTSARTLESFYWMGVKAYYNNDIALNDLPIGQWEVYEFEENKLLQKEIALKALLQWMQHNELKTLLTQTQILIAPGYKFKMVDYLVTNFHQPHSTLLLLIAAAVGDKWKLIYDHALRNDYRFLSYGDGCLLEVDKNITT